MAKLLSTIIDGFISSRKFVSGLLGEGWKIWRSNDRYKLEIDDIVVRNTMTVFELLISKIRAIKGALGITQASGKVKSVREESGNYYLEIEEEMSFMAHDIVRCMEFNGGLRSYWVVISEVNGHEIVVDKSEFGGVVPLIGDELVQFGNTVYANRQSAIYLHADENGEPAIDVLQGIDGKTFEDKIKLRVGGLSDITDTDFPEGVKGFGIYSQNGYFKGTIAGAGIYLLRPDGSGYLAGGAISWDKNGNLTFGSNVVLNWDNLSTEAQANLKGEKGEPGNSGMSIVWKGDSISAPSNPQKNWVYRNTNSGIVYIYNGSQWEVMITDGNDGVNGTNGSNGTDGKDGWNVFITYSDSETEPTSPTGNGTSDGWHTNAAANVIWMSQKVASQADTGTWGKPIKVKGEKGADGLEGPAGEDANLLPWIEEWDNNKTQIGSTTVISPKIFAGTNSGTAASPSLTGVALGKGVVNIDGTEKTGIFGFKNGKVTFSIDAETGDTMYRGQLNVNDKCIIGEDGHLTAIDARISGSISATEGQLGNLKVEGSYLTAANGPSMQFLSENSGVRFLEISKVEACLKIRNDEEGRCIDIANYGGKNDTACLSILNNGRGYAMECYGNVRFGLREKESIIIDKGCIIMRGGLAMGTIVTMNSMTLDISHYNVMCENESTITITLPFMSLSSGSTYYIRKCGKGNVKIATNGDIPIQVGASVVSSESISSRGTMVRAVFFTNGLITDGKWYINYIGT